MMVYIETSVLLRLDSTAECYADKVMLSDSEKSLTFARFQ